MTAELFSTSEQIWKRIGLHELRSVLENVTNAAKSFEQALRELPTCDECAKLALLEYIQNTGRKLGTQAASLSVLAESLKGSADVAQNLKSNLIEHAPKPCKCNGKVCSCHHG